MEFIPENPWLKFKPDTLEVLRKRHNLDHNRMVQSIELLEDWIKKQTHFSGKRFRREFLERKIVSCKGSVEKVKSQIEKLCTMKTLCSKFFVCSDVKNRFAKVSDIVSCVPLPEMTDDYRRIYVLHVNDLPFEVTDVMEFYKLNIVIAEYLMRHDYVDGFVAIADLRVVNLMETLKILNFTEFQQFITILIEGFGARVKAVHLVSESKIIDLFVKTIKPFLPVKIAERINVHQNTDTLHDHIDKRYLPIDFGGTLPSLKELKADLMAEISSPDHEKHLKTTVELRTDESLRTIENFNETCLGLPGSFRTLTVD